MYKCNSIITNTWRINGLPYRISKDTVYDGENETWGDSEFGTCISISLPIDDGESVKSTRRMKRKESKEWKGGGKEGNLRLLKAWKVYLSKRLIDDDGIPSSFTTCQGWSQPLLTLDFFPTSSRSKWMRKKVKIDEFDPPNNQHHITGQDGDQNFDWISIINRDKIIKMENSIFVNGTRKLWTSNITTLRDQLNPNSIYNQG